MEQRHVPVGRDLLVYCKGGVRSRKVIKKIREGGWGEQGRIWEIKGGIMAWRKDIDKSLAEY